MTAPFKPTLLTPGPRGAATPPTVVFTARFNSFEAGVAAHQYAVRRRGLSPTLGAYQYWDGAAWVGTLTWLTAPVGLFDGDVLEVTTDTGWGLTLNTIREWSVSFRNAALEESGFATPHLLSLHTQPSLLMNLEDPATDSRPTLRWVFQGGTGKRQRSVRFALYPQAVADAPNFDASAANWQTQATWIMPLPMLNSLISKMEIGIDLDTAADYEVFYITEDDFGYSSGWLSGGSFTTNLTPPAAPTLEVVRNTGQGTVQVTVASTFNLLSVDNSEFKEGFGTWFAHKNCFVEWSTSGGEDPNTRMLVTVSGMLYNDMLAAHASFTAQDTAYATYDQEKAAQSAPLGFALVRHASNIPDMIPVNAGDVYSAIANIESVDVSLNCRIRIYWYDVSGVFISGSPGDVVNCQVGLPTNIRSVAATAPAGATWAQIEIEAESASGNRLYVDAVGFSRSSSIEWTPGGLAVDIGFVIQKRVNGGAWVDLWNASRLNRLSPDNAVSTVASVRDRSAVLGVEGVQYRAFTVTAAAGSLVYSSPTVGAIPVQRESTWWLRSVPRSSLDTAIRTGTFEVSKETKEEVVAPRRRKFSMVVANDEAPGNTVSVGLMTLDRGQYLKVEALLESGDLLYLQRNIGDGFLIRRTGRIRRSQRRAKDISLSNNTVRHVHDWQFEAEIVDPVEAYR